MDAQDRVFNRYHDAEAVEEPPIFRHGDGSPVEPSQWAIYAGHGLEIGPLGVGRTEAKAWADAARRLMTHEAA